MQILTFLQYKPRQHTCSLYCSLPSKMAGSITRIEDAVIRILGRTPEFAGIVSDYFGDSRIEMRKGPNNNDLQAKVCKAKTVGQTSNLVRAMSTSKF